MVTSEQRNRNTCLSIARSRARSGHEADAGTWLRLAGGFAEVTDRHRASVARAVEQGRRARVIPGQLTVADAAR